MNDYGSSISPQHSELLAAAAINLDVALEAGVRSEADGLVFVWTALDGTMVEQRRPDKRQGDAKYLFPKDTNAAPWVHPRMRDRVGQAATVVFVEGTKQYLAAVSAAPNDVLVVGIAGCWGWSDEKLPHADVQRLVADAEDVVVSFDADLSSNRDVWEAADRFGRALKSFDVKQVRWLRLPAGGTKGLDDWLARIDDRPKMFVNLVRDAGRLPGRPKDTPRPQSDVEADPSGRFFDMNGLRVDTLWRALREIEHLALDRSDRMLVYRNGVYVDGRHAVAGVIADLLGERFRPMHVRALVEFGTARLAVAGRVIPDEPNGVWVNVANGLLDPFEGVLKPHTPQHLSMVQLPIAWNPKACCVTFDKWVNEVTDGRGDDLLEACARFLDRRRRWQKKAVFLFGPTRSAKSTWIRLLEATAGAAARSAVTLQQLAEDRFAAADLYGCLLNAAADLSAAHVDDLALFKQLTGDDPIRAQRKYGQPFTFHAEALFVFSANEIPTVSEVSRAYLARLRPFEFPTSYEGREDPGIEEKMLGELEGILVRLVQALQRFARRGRYVEDERTAEVLDAFARRSDRVRLFLWEATEEEPNGFTARGELFETFERWCTVNRRQPLGRHRFFESVELAGYRQRATRGFAGLVVLPEVEWASREPAPRRQNRQNSPSSRFTRETDIDEGEEVSESPREGRVWPEVPVLPPNANGHQPDRSGLFSDEAAPDPGSYDFATHLRKDGAG